MCIEKIDHARFKISGIEHGWIFAEIAIGDKYIALSNSYLGGLQMPKIFLKTFTQLLNQSENEKWLCWHGESNSYIWHLFSKNEIVQISIYEGDCSFGLPLEGKISNFKVNSSDIMLKMNTSLYSFASSVSNAIKFYSYGVGYDTWQNSKYKDEFPKSEFSQLRKSLRSLKCGNL